jgi:replication fork protection complex subunit Tof1/Swi1
MNLVGIRRVAPELEETLESMWIIPPDISADRLREYVDLINQAEFSPPVFEEGVLAEHQLRRKSAPRKRAAIEEESDEDLEALFPAGGPTNRRAIDEPDRPKKTRRRRSQEPDDEELAERARKRREREREKARKIKSDMYVHASDEEWDEERNAEFFAREAEQKLSNQRAAEMAGQGVPGLAILNPKKRKADSPPSEGSEDEDEDEDANPSSKVRSGAAEDEDASDDVDETPPSSSPQSFAGKRRRLSPSEAEAVVEDDEDVPTVKMRARPRIKAGFVIDSSDEE